MKFRHLAALHGHCAHAIDAVQRRLQIVDGDLPQLGLRHGIRREAVAEDRKGRKGQPVGGDLGRGRERLLHLIQRRIHQLELLKHVLVPVEEEADLRRAAAGSGAHILQPRNGIHSVLDGLGDGHLHLFYRHHAVVYADDHARKVSGRKDRDRHLEGQVDAGHCEHSRKKEDGAG